MKKVLTAPEVASLYGVDKSTVHRWIERGLLPEPTLLPSPSGQRDRPLFDAAAIGALFEEEIAPLRQTDMAEWRLRYAHLKEVLDV